MYGNDRELTDALDSAGETYLMDVAGNYQVCERDPDACAQQAGPSQPRRGRPGNKARLRRESAQQSVKQLSKNYFEKESRIGIE